MSGLATSYGWTAAAAAVALLLGLATMHAAKPPLGGLCASCALACAGFALAMSGHTATAGPQLLSRPAVFLHGICVAFWVGSLIPLVAVVRDGGRGDGELARFSRLIPIPLAVLIATGARPRELPGAVPDGERLLTSRQLYDLPELPSDLIVVGSGVTGAEFASGFQALGSRVTFVSSREHVLPNEDTDAAMVVEGVFRRRGMTVLSKSRAESASRTADGVEVRLEDGRTVRGSHCLLTVGMVPSTEDIGLAESGVAVDERGFIMVDRVSRTFAPGVYAAGDCTGVWMLASVAAMQGRIAMWHSLGEAVQPLRLGHVAATIFTEPEIAAVGASQQDVDSGKVLARAVKLPLATNARAKMDGFSDGFVKLFARQNSGIVLGGVIVAPRASDLILGVSLAVEQQLTVDEVAHTFAVYPSLTGSITEAARQLMQPADDPSR